MAGEWMQMLIEIRRAARHAFMLATVVFATTAHAAAGVELRLTETGSTPASVVEMRGKIEPGDAARVEQFIAALPRGRAVAVNMISPGGSVSEALQIGRLFYANAVSTYVRGAGARCLSACALAFLGGRDAQGVSFRVKGSQAALGYHAFRRVEEDREYTIDDMRRATARSQDVLLQIADYLVAVDASIEFMSMMLEAPSDQMYYLDNEKALKVGVHVLDEQNGRLLLAPLLKPSVKPQPAR